MTISSIGDLAMSFQMRRDAGRAKTELSRHAQELSSGVIMDVAGQLKGDFSHLSRIEHDLVKLNGYESVVNEHRLFINTQQSVVQKLRDLGSISATFLGFPEVTNAASIDSAGADALMTFEAALQSLNTQSGGRTVFSGIGVNQPAVAIADTVLTAIEAEIVTAGAATAEEVASVVSAWFNAGGGYEAIGYVGDVAQTTGLRLSENEVARSPVTAEDPAVRDQLSSLAMGALVGRHSLMLDRNELGNLIRITGQELLASNDQLISLQARIGQSENQVERASAEIAAQRDAMRIAKSELIEIDPYESATALQNAETQLQTMYTITSRLSRLSLVEYL